jgi:hypothetical protein
MAAFFCIQPFQNGAQTVLLFFWVWFFGSFGRCCGFNGVLCDYAQINLFPRHASY